jgi:pimeloyl-ACP methyl ester carboxylesterase
LVRKSSPAGPPLSLADAHALGRLGFDSVTGVTSLVEAVHRTIAGLTPPLGASPQGGAGGISGFVYSTVRGVTRLAGGGWKAIGAMLPDAGGKLDPRREAWVAAINGVFGEHLAKTANPLAVAMQFRHEGRALSLETDALRKTIGNGRGKLVVLLHGLCMNDLQWQRQGHDHGRMLADRLGFVPLYLYYNSGRHVSENGREFAALLARLVDAWPEPVEELVLVGHSMGGLLARSACHYAELEKLAWRKKLKRIVFLGTPHQGAPLERAGSHVDLVLELSPYLAPFARLGKSRSAGIKDLRHGNVLDEDWSHPGNTATRDHRHPLPLPAGVRCHALAASLQEAPVKSGKRPRGDGLVPVASALGEHANPAFHLRFAADDSHVVYGCNHFDLLARDEVADRLLAWCGEAKGRAR